MIAVVVPNWNGAARLPACIGSLAAQTCTEIEIVVVDNGSVDDSLAVLDRLAAEVAPVVLTVVRNAENLGFAGGVNRGITVALDRGARAVALFNNDAVAEPDWLAALVAELDARPDVAIVTSRLLHGDGATVDSTGDFYTSWGLPYPRDRDAASEPVRPSGEVFGGSGGASLYRAELFADVGLFDERFFVLLEDVDFSFRARLAGHRAWYRADAVVYHDQGSTQRTVSGMAAKQYVRNLPVLLVKDVPDRLLWRGCATVRDRLPDADRQPRPAPARSGRARRCARRGAVAARRPARPARHPAQPPARRTGSSTTCCGRACLRTCARPAPSGTACAA